MNHPDCEVALRDVLAALALGAVVAGGPSFTMVEAFDAIADGVGRARIDLGALDPLAPRGF